MNVTKNKIITKTYRILICGQFTTEDLIEAKSSKEAQLMAEKKYYEGFYETKEKEIRSPRIYEREIIKTTKYLGK